MSTLRISLLCIHLGPGDEAVPLGAACVASALKAALGDRVSVSLVEAFLGESATAIAERLAEGSPALVGVSLYLWNRELSLEAASLLRKRFPSMRFFAGGPDAGARPEGLLTASDTPAGPGGFDFVVTGEGEEAVVTLVKAILDGRSPDPSLGPCPLLDAETLPSPWLDGTLNAGERRHVLWEMARGCPYNCTYCYESRGEHRLRRLSASRLDAELEAFAKGKVESVFVLDPTFNANEERAVAFLDRLEKLGGERGWAPHWHFEVRAEHLNRALAKRFARLGSSLQIGLQSADPEVSAKVGRKLNRGLFTSKIELLNEEGAVFGLDLIYGLPGDRLSGFRQSLDYALSLYPNNLDLFRLAILPGTTLAGQAEGFGLQYDREAPYLVKSTPSFGVADLVKAEQLSAATDLFYNRGRAVAWFNQVLHPLGDRASSFLEGFLDFAKAQALVLPLGKAEVDRRNAADPVWIERLQLAYLDRRFEEAEMEYLLPAVWDVVRFNGAWARAIAEGISSDIDFNYDPDEVTSEASLDLENFVSLAELAPCSVRVKATDGEPYLSVLD